MHEATFVVIAGLCFDIAGGIIIVSPLLFLVRRHWGDSAKVVETELGMVDINAYKAEDKKAQKRARIGVGLLVFGFILQALGNWLENPPTINFNG